MIPEIGSEWIARDGRKMRVEEVVVPTLPSDTPWCRMTVLNASKGMRRKTQLSTSSFGSETHIGFLRPLTNPSHDPSGVISEPKGDSEMPGRRPRDTTQEKT